MSALKKVVKIFIFICCSIGIIYAYLMAFPQLLYKHHLSYRQYEFYSNEIIDSNIYEIVDTSIRLLSRSEMYDSSIRQKVFFIHNTFHEKMCSFYSKNKAGFHEYFINNSMIVPEVDIEKDQLVYDSTHHGIFHQTLVHETIHSMQENSIGLYGVLTAPKWLLEGSAFYVAKPNILLKKGLLNQQLIANRKAEIQSFSSKSAYTKRTYKTVQSTGSFSSIHP